MKSTSHQDIGTPGRQNRKGKLNGDLDEQECSAERYCRNVGSREYSTENKLAPAKITVTWSQLKATADSL